MKPTFFENLIGSWPGAILLGGVGVVACLVGIATFHESAIPAMVLMYGGILAVKHAVRVRSRVSHMREFGRQWARVAGWDEPPTRGVKGWLWWAAKSAAMLALLVACGAFAYWLWGPEASAEEEGRGGALTLFWALFATVLAVLFHKQLYLFWQARKERKRRYEEGSEVDGKQLPRAFVDQALSVPMRSPGAAWFTQELPEYCLSLLKRRPEGLADAADDDSIEDASQNNEAPSRRFVVPRDQLIKGGAVGLVGVAALLIAAGGGGMFDGLLAYVPASWLSEAQRQAYFERQERRHAQAPAPPSLPLLEKAFPRPLLMPPAEAFARFMLRTGWASDETSARSSAKVFLAEAAARRSLGARFLVLYYEDQNQPENAREWEKVAEEDDARVGVKSEPAQPAPPAVASQQAPPKEAAAVAPLVASPPPPSVQATQAELAMSADQLTERADGIFRSLDAQAPGNSEAFRLYSLAAPKGSPRAQIMMSYYLLDGSHTECCGIPRDIAVGLAWLERAGQQGSSEALSKLGFIYEVGNYYVQKDRSKAMSYYERASKASDGLDAKLAAQKLNDMRRGRR